MKRFVGFVIACFGSTVTGFTAAGSSAMTVQQLKTRLRNGTIGPGGHASYHFAGTAGNFGDRANKTAERMAEKNRQCGVPSQVHSVVYLSQGFNEVSNAEDLFKYLVEHDLLKEGQGNSIRTSFTNTQRIHSWPTEPRKPDVQATFAGEYIERDGKQIYVDSSLNRGEAGVGWYFCVQVQLNTQKGSRLPKYTYAVYPIVNESR